MFYSFIYQEVASVAIHNILADSVQIHPLDIFPTFVLYLCKIERTFNYWQSSGIGYKQNNLLISQNVSGVNQTV